VHPFMPAVLQWLARLDELGDDAQPDPQSSRACPG
jgi:hypothetical protein